MIKRTQELEVILTPEELAAEFCNMDDKEQAKFFNEIGNIVQNTWTSPFVFQLQAVIDSEHLTDDGRYVMQSVGEYGR